MFKKLEGDQAVVCLSGVYRLCDVYEWNSALFIKIGAGFIRVYENGSTTKEKVFLTSIATERPLFRDKFGRITLSAESGIALAAPATQKLLGLPND
jgi:hypothetical protein